jgi:hypothetical protein
MTSLKINFTKVEQLARQGGGGPNGLWIQSDDSQAEEQRGEEQSHGAGNEDLCTALRVFFRFGKLLAILPVDGLFSTTTCTENLKHR